MTFRFDPVQLLREQGQDDYIGEPISQLEHALQCAALAAQAGGSDALVAAALLHDIGHLCAGDDDPVMPGLGVVHHEHLGAAYLAQAGYPQHVCELVRGHVEAKRYLVATKPGYAARLSPASQGTLALQGGPLSADEVRRFDADPLSRDKLRLRVFDERAKQRDLDVPTLEHYAPLLARVRKPVSVGEADLPGYVPLRATLTDEELASFRAHGYLHLRGYFAPALRDRIRAWLLAMETWPETPGRWMMYFETPPAGPRRGQRLLCRMESFLEAHAGLDQLLQHSNLMQVLAQLMGEPAVLFKEKINFKLAGGQGFMPHQDAPAFVTFGQRYHITAMIGIDPTTRDNGCLEVVRHMGGCGLLPQAEDGTIAPATVRALTWEAVTTEPGDLLLFDSYLPHRSGDNDSDGPRRALYVTYNRRSEGQRRAAYYRDKRERFPPECERVPGRDYSAGSAVYNLANPIPR